MKNMYAMVNRAIKAGAVKVFVVGYAEGNSFFFTEVGTLVEAKRVYTQMKSEGHRPGIDVYTR